VFRCGDLYFNDGHCLYWLCFTLGSNVFLGYLVAQNVKIMSFSGPHDIKVLSCLFGTLLGDSYGEKRNGKSRIVLQQENSNQEYLFWVHQLLSIRGYCSPIKPKPQYRTGTKK
jgi:hypothetical protein